MSQISAEEQRGHDLMAQGEKTLNKFSWFGLANGAKTEDAIVLFSKAANNFKTAQKWQLAGAAFEKCAELYTKVGQQFEAANQYVSAADMYGRVDSTRSVALYQSGISIMCDNGRFGAAAKQCETIAGVFEKDNDIQQALVYFQKAADYYNGDNSPSRANKSLEKVGEYSATLADYKRACEVFEKLGLDCLSSNLLKFNAKKHFLHWGMCMLCRGDNVAAKNGIEKFTQEDYTFADSREGKLLSSLLECTEELDADKLSDILYAYDAISKLNPWETSILLRLKNALQEQGDADPDLQ